MKRQVCVICKRIFVGYGNNAEPVSSGRCCDFCNELVIIPARILQTVNVRKIKKGENNGK